MTDKLYEQLKQISDAPNGVWAGDLINKDAARELVAMGAVANSGGSPSSLNVLTITTRGRCNILDGCVHSFRGWREFPDGSGGEQVCAKCGMGAMVYSMKHS